MSDMTEEIKELLGDWPIVRARSHREFLAVCKALGLNPHRTTSGLNLRSLEGTRPTSIVYAPGWQEDQDWQRGSEMIDRLVVTMRQRPGVFYLREADLR